MTSSVEGPVRSEVIVIGAGPAGLAVGACLRRAGLSTVILEQAETVGASWHQHYDRLHLHTAKTWSALPHLPFPRHFPRYPSRLQVVEYLEEYARHFGLQPRFGQRVVTVRRAGDAEWEAVTEEGRFRARHLVVAGGACREPVRPQWPDQELFGGEVLHSSEFRNGEEFTGRTVLVVGFGNSGGEIALDLSEHGADTMLSVRGPVNVIPRDLFGVPVQGISIAEQHLPARWADTLNRPLAGMVMGDLSPYGLHRPSIGPVEQIERRQRIPLIDVGTIDHIKQGRIRVRPGIDRFTPTGVVFSDGDQTDVDAVVLATGYRPGVATFLTEVPGACDSDGMPVTSGAHPVRRGLYFCGYHIVSTGMLRTIGLEARSIAAQIVDRQQARTPTG